MNTDTGRAKTAGTEEKTDKKRWRGKISERAKAISSLPTGDFRLVFSCAHSGKDAKKREEEKEEIHVATRHLVL